MIKLLIIRSRKKLVLGMTFVTLGLTLSACGPAYQSPSAKNLSDSTGATHPVSPQQKSDAAAAEDLYQKPLTPTYSYGPGFNVPENIKKYYDPMPNEIKTKTAVVRLGQTHFQNVQYLYDFKNKKIKITGHLQILDQQGKSILTENDFELSGEQNITSPVVVLNSTADSKKDKNANAAIIKAKVTCLGLRDAEDGSDHDEISCDKAVVDFFVSYNKQYLTDQFETKSAPVKKQNAPPEQKNSNDGFAKSNPLTPKSTPASQDNSYNEVSKTASADTTTAKAASTDTTENTPDHKNNEPEYETEGSDGSINSRYQGQVENTDVVALFNDDADKTQATKDKKTEAKKEAKTDQKKSDKKSGASSQDASPAEVKSTSEKSSSENPTAKVINSNVEQTADGSLRPYNQAVGYPDDGRLRNATNLKDQQASQKEQGLYVILSSKQRYYATFEMSEFISKLAKFLTNAESTRLYVGNISAQKGGHISPHQSHQIGMDADFGYPTENSRASFPVVARGGSINKSAYSVERTFETFKFAFKQKHSPIEKIFVDQLIINDLCHYARSKNEFTGEDAQVVKTLFQNIQHVDGHGNHFHVRLKCTPSQPACRSKQYRRVNNCASQS